MAISWRCPLCSETNSESDSHATGHALACHSCERALLPQETLCTVCDAPNPWWRRDSLHYVCRECGHSQTYYSHLAAADTREADESAA